MLQLIMALLLTILIENAVLYIICVREREDFLLVTLVNIVTNITANVLYQLNLKYNVIDRYMCMAILETAVVVSEWLYMKRYMKTEIDPFRTAVIINVASFAGGIIWNYFF